MGNRATLSARRDDHPGDDDQRAPRARTWPPAPKVRAPWFSLINGWLYIRADHKIASVISFLLGLGLSVLTAPPNGNRRVERTWGVRLAALDSLEQAALAALSDAALRTHVGRLLSELAWWWMEITWVGGTGRTCAQVLTQMDVPGVPDPMVLFRGNDSLLMEAERVLRQAAHDPGKIEMYLTRFGHMVESADPIQPTLRESPELLVWQLAAARQSERDPDERLAEIRREREQATASVQAMAGIRGYIARKLLAVGQSHAAHTDNAVFHFQRVLAAIRSAFLEAGGAAREGR
jgi:hypothetical protein